MVPMFFLGMSIIICYLFDIVNFLVIQLLPTDHRFF